MVRCKIYILSAILATSSQSSSPFTFYSTSALHLRSLWHILTYFYIELAVNTSQKAYIIFHECSTTYCVCVVHKCVEIVLPQYVRVLLKMISNIPKHAKKCASGLYCISKVRSSP